MKYTIEAAKKGCIETLEFSNGEKFSKQSERTAHGCAAMSRDFSDQLKRAGYCEEIVELVDDLFDGFGSLDFMHLAELEG